MCMKKLHSHVTKIELIIMQLKNDMPMHVTDTKSHTLLIVQVNLNAKILLICILTIKVVT